VLGETELALERAHTAEARGEALRRIRLAATQIRRRVEELLLLARASAGQRASLTDLVELDGLALECADLMRGRAHALGRRLELGRVDPVVVTASEPLLREAVVELLENACRHGSGGAPVRLSVFREAKQAIIEVANGAGEGAPWPPGAVQGQGLGLQVVRWIAAEHGGRLLHRTEADSVLSALSLPTNGAHAPTLVPDR
jgi:two-component system heavy metal sensor histidine kinase CusS